jgi:hypothetical protein
MRFAASCCARAIALVADVDAGTRAPSRPETGVLTDVALQVHEVEAASGPVSGGRSASTRIARPTDAVTPSSASSSGNRVEPPARRKPAWSRLWLSWPE